MILNYNNEDSSYMHSNNPIFELQSQWQNEKFTEELLPYPTKLLSKILINIENTDSKLKNKHSNTSNTNTEIEADKRLPVINEIKELDLERVKFLVKDFLRIRLAKINKYLIHIIKKRPKPV